MIAVFFMTWQISLSSAEEECTRQQASCQQLHAELQMLGDKSDQQMKELSDLTGRLQVKFGHLLCCLSSVSMN
jgi:hypothetical protein